MNRNGAALIFIAIGLLLSAIMIVPSVRSIPVSSFSIKYHLTMFVALVAPFIVIYLVFRNNSSNVSPIAFGTPFSLTHAYLIYVTYAYPPQEFGYVGLIFAPVLEAVVAVPLALLIIFAIKPRAKRSSAGNTSETDI
jgi:hypothetical protein